MILAILLMFSLSSALAEDCQGLVIRMSPADLWDHADTVLIGAVKDITVHRDESGMIYEQVRVQVERYRKNPLNTSEVTVIVLGGQVGDLGVWVEDQPSFDEGEHVLVYLECYPNKDISTEVEGYYVVGGPQGKFTIDGGTARNEVGDTLFILPFELEGMSYGIQVTLGSAFIVIAALIFYRRKTR